MTNIDNSDFLYGLSLKNEANNEAKLICADFLSFILCVNGRTPPTITSQYSSLLYWMVNGADHLFWLMKRMDWFTSSCQSNPEHSRDLDFSQNHKAPAV